jgi:hypothetical protein
LYCIVTTAVGDAVIVCWTKEGPGGDDGTDEHALEV